MTKDETQAIEIRGTTLGEAFRIERGARSRRAPGAGEVLIRNQATGLNHIDLLALRGEMPPNLQPEAPFVPGVEGAGVVEAVGEGVERVKAGDRVMWFGDLGAGGIGSHVLAARHQVVALGGDLSVEAAAALPVAYTTALHMLTNLSDAPRGSWVLVHAAGGGVGLALVELARLLGHRVVATDVEAKREAILDAGADVFVDFRSERVEDAVRDATAGRGLSLSLNSVGGDTLSGDFAMLEPFGSVVLYGFLGGLPTGSILETMVPHFDRSVSLRVSDIYTLSRALPELFEDTLRRVARYAVEGRIHPEFKTFDGAREALDAMERKTHVGKLVVTERAWAP